MRTRQNTATVYEQEGKKILRFTNFETSNGPDVRVYLIAAGDANDSETVKKAGWLHIAPLKGNIGDQNYELPADVDFSKYRAVTIWCQRFSVNFGTAPLTQNQMMMGENRPVELAKGTFHDVARTRARTTFFIGRRGYWQMAPRALPGTICGEISLCVSWSY